MPDSEHAIAIAAAAEDRPDDRTLKPRKPTREPNGTLWFSAELNPTGDQVWVQIEEKPIRRMPDRTPEGRSRRLLDALRAMRFGFASTAPAAKPRRVE